LYLFRGVLNPRRLRRHPSSSPDWKLSRSERIHYRLIWLWCGDGRWFFIKHVLSCHNRHESLSKFNVAQQGRQRGGRQTMNWQSRLEKTMIALNLIGLAIGFSTLGILILVRGGHGSESSISGVLGIVVGSLFLLFAFYFCKHTLGRWFGKVSARGAGLLSTTPPGRRTPDGYSH
jgi:hypothetical protein